MKRLNHGNFSGRRDLLDGLLKSQYRDGHTLPLGEIAYVHMSLYFQSLTNVYWSATMPTSLCKTSFFHISFFPKTNISSLAAPDTASVALRSILINLVRNRDVYNEVMAELTCLKLSNPATWKELEGAPLLHAIVKETLRLHPPAGFNLPRAVPAGGRTVCGHYLPEGTTVGMSAWCVHANEDFWGKDTLEFKPQRWLDPESAFKLDRYGLSFGQGARACLGKNIAMVQLVKVCLCCLPRALSLPLPGG